MTNFFINGLGVYGRAIAKQLITSNLNASVHFNDSNYEGDTNKLAYLLNYDTWNMGNSFYTNDNGGSNSFSVEASGDKNYIVYKGQRFPLTFAEAISDIQEAAKESQSTVYIDCTGKHTQTGDSLLSSFDWVFTFPGTYIRNTQIYSYLTSASLDKNSVVQIASPELMALSIALQGIGNSLSPISANYNCFVGMGNSLFVQDSMEIASNSNFSLGRSCLNVIQKSDDIPNLLATTVPSFPTGITTGRSFYIPLARCGLLSLTVTFDKEITQEDVDQILNSFTSTYIAYDEYDYPVSSDVLNTDGFILIPKNSVQWMSSSGGSSMKMDVIFDNTYKYMQMLCNEVYDAVQN